MKEVYGAIIERLGCKVFNLVTGVQISLALLTLLTLKYNNMKKILSLIKRGVNAYLTALSKCNYTPTGTIPFGI